MAAAASHLLLSISVCVNAADNDAPLALPLPPNMAINFVADVDGNTMANDAFWAAKCKQIPEPETEFIVVDMGVNRNVENSNIITVGPTGEVGVDCVFPFTYKGKEYTRCTDDDSTSGFWCSTVSTYTSGSGSWGMCPGDYNVGPVRDFFKPISKAVSYCTMLQSHNKHLWSNDGVNWRQPGSHTNPLNNGGSAKDWPKNNVVGDSRTTLSFWGHATDVRYTGGCCSASTSLYSTSPYNDASFWHQSFTLSYGFRSSSTKTTTTTASHSSSE